MQESCIAAGPQPGQLTSLSSKAALRLLQRDSQLGKQKVEHLAPLLCRHRTGCTVRHAQRAEMSGRTCAFGRHACRPAIQQHTDTRPLLPGRRQSGMHTLRGRTGVCLQACRHIRAVQHRIVQVPLPQQPKAVVVLRPAQERADQGRTHGSQATRYLTGRQALTMPTSHKPAALADWPLRLQLQAASAAS